MKELEYIINKLEEHGLKIAGNPVLSEGNELNYKIFVVHDNHLYDKQKKLINDIKNEKKLKISVNIVSINDYAGEAIYIIRKNLAAEFEDYIESVIHDTYSNDKIIYVNLKNDLTDEKEGKIKDKSESLLRMLHLNGYEILLTHTDERPSLLEIAKIIKILAPVTIDGILINLEDRGYARKNLSDVPDKIKSLEEKRLIIQSEDKKYAMTYRGIITLGSSRLKNNEDLKRVLAISRLIR